MAKKVKKLHVTVKPVRIEGLPAVSGDVTPSAMVEVKWKGPVTGFGFGLLPFYRSNRLTNRTALKPVVGCGHVEWDDEFERICCLAGTWNLSFNVFYGENIDAKNRKGAVGKASLDLAELASRIESKVEKKIPIISEGSGMTKEFTLLVSVAFSEVRSETGTARLAQNSLDSEADRTMVYCNSESSSSSDTGSSSGELNPEAESGSPSGSDSRPEPGSKPRFSPWKRRRLSFSLSWKREPREDEGTEISAVATKPEESETSIESKKWEMKDLMSRNGKFKLRSQVFFASLDQRSEQAGGEAACAVVAVVMAHWLRTNPNRTPSGSEFDSIITQGSWLWKSLCNDESYQRLFPDKHFDLETIVSAKLRPIRVCSDRSLTGVFSPEKFDSLKGLMSFDDIWDEVAKHVSGLDRGESRVYILSWNDHFFVMRAEHDGYLIIDSLGERLFEGCKQAYILKFDDWSLMYEKKILEKSRSAEEEEEEENPNPNPNPNPNSDEEEEEAVVSRGKECCREYVKRFLAEIPVTELAAAEEKGELVDTSLLHQKLQFDLHHILLTD